MKFKSVLAIVVVCGTAAIAIGCCTRINGGQNLSDLVNANAENQRLKEQLNRQENDLRELARKCHISESRINSSSMSGLITEIEIVLDSQEFYGKTLSENELMFLKDVCEDRPDLFNKIQNYDSYVKKMNLESN